MNSSISINVNGNHVKPEHSNLTQELLDLLIEDKQDIPKVKQFAMTVCKEYLGGVWKAVGIDEFKITRIL